MNSAWWGDPVIICPLGSSLKEITSKIVDGEVAYRKLSENELFSGFPAVYAGKMTLLNHKNNYYKAESILENLLNREELKNHKDVDAVLMYYKCGSYYEHTRTNHFLPKQDSTSAYNILASQQFNVFKENVFVFDNTCASGLSLLSIAMNGVVSKLWKKVLVVAIDLIELRELFSIMSLGAMANPRLSGDRYVEKPFDKKRNGFIKSESASAAIVTIDPTCLKQSLGKIKSYHQTNDGFRITDGRDDSLFITKSMENALEKAKLIPQDLSFIKAHGTGTKLNDLHEANAILKIFGNSIPVTSFKGSLGHTTDASGLVESILASYEFGNGRIIPTFGCTEKDFDLNIIQRPMVVQGKYYMSNAFGFGGNNLSVIFEI